jgi:predicted GIY-YIG superfamily endonuclease
MKQDGWFVYILKCADDSLYTGITTDLERRLRGHNAGEASRYTRTRLPVSMVYLEAHPDRSAASIREAALKALSRDEKLRLIRSLPKKSRSRLPQTR